MKLVSLPFHWVYPSAPAKYVGCRISIPVYDPASPERSEAIVRAARVISFNAAVGSVNGKKFRGPKLPKCVYLPTAHIRIIRKDFGNGSKVIGRQIRYLGFRRYKIKHIMTMPFAWCPSEAANLKTAVEIMSACGG